MIKSPFKFLDSFTREDRKIFFGRDQEISELHRRVFESKILLVYGVSGTGKSSLINCGLASRLDDSDWLPVNIRRGRNIIESIAENFDKQALTPLKKSLSIPEKLQSIYLDHFKPVYLIFDQFEELFIFGNDEEKKGFIKLIKEIIDSETQCRIFFIIREEFLAGITEFESDLPEIFSNRFRVEKMKRANALLAIEGPCKVHGIETESGFAEELIDKLCPAGNEIELTYLQIYLDRIFRLATTQFPPYQGGQGGANVPSQGGTKGVVLFSKSLLSRAGNVSDLLGQFLDEQIRDLEDPETAMAILKSFVSVQGTKKQMTEPEILDSVGAFGTTLSHDELLKSLEKFVELRILRERDEEGHFELRHDSLAAKIFEKFTAIEKDIIEVRQFLESEYSIYEKRGKLLTQEDLKYIAPYESKLYLNKQTEAFINNSKKEITRTRNRRRKIATAIVMALIIVLSGFTVWALNERRIAEKQKEKAVAANLVAEKAEMAALQERNHALENEKLALENEKVAVMAKEEAETAKGEALKEKENAFRNYLKARANNFSYLSQKIVEKDPVVALRLAEYAKSLDSSNPDIIENLYRVYYENNFYKIVANHKGEILSVAFSPDSRRILTGSADSTARLWDLHGNLLQILRGHVNSVSSVAFSADGKMMLTGSGDKTAILWDMEGNVLQVFKGHEGQIYSVAFSPDNNSIVTGSFDRTARLWDLKGRVVKVLAGHERAVNSVAFSPDGLSILTCSGDKTARLWDLQGNVIQIFIGHDDPVRSGVFSPDGKNILTGSQDKTARIWDLRGNIIQVFKGHENGIFSVAFSPGGKKILTVAGDNLLEKWDKTARLWDLQGNVLQEFRGHEKLIVSITFSPDGKSILTGSFDKTARLWELQGNLLEIFRGHEGGVVPVAFSPDGKTILTGSIDKTARLWDLKGNLLQVFSGHGNIIIAAAFSPDGKNILTGASDNTARLWDLKGNVLQIFKGHEAGVAAVAFSADGRNILTGSVDKTGRLWDLKGNVLQVFRGHTNMIMSAAFSPDNQNILTGSLDKTAILWDLRGNVKQVFRGHGNSVAAVVFFPDGRRILTGSYDFTARLWDLKGNSIETFKGHGAEVNSVAVSRDGKTILTVSDDKTARLWDMQGHLLQVFRGHESPVESGAFSPDDKTILTGSDDETARLWEIKKTIQEFRNENNYEELSVGQKIDYDIIEFSEVSQFKDEMSLNEAAEYYFNQIKISEKGDKAGNINNAVYLYSKLLNQSFNSKYLIRLLNTYSLAKGIISDKVVITETDFLFNKLISSKDPVGLSSGADYFNSIGFESFDRKERQSAYRRSIQLGEKVMKDFPQQDVKTTMASAYNNLSLELLFIKNFKEALEYARKCVSLVNGSVQNSKLVLACLFTDNYEEALRITENSSMRFVNAVNFKVYILARLEELEKEGITNDNAKKLKEAIQKMN